MSPSSRKMAEQFMRDQINIMKKYGKEPKINAEQKKKMLNDTQAAFESLRGAGSRKIA
jgi:hypothetical protein